MLRIHLVRHFPAVKDAAVEKALGVTEGGKRRPLDVKRALELGPIFRTELLASNPNIVLLGHSPADRAAMTMVICTAGIVYDDVLVVEVPELYWTDESIAGIMGDFKSHGVNLRQWSPEGLAALDLLGKQGANGIKRVIEEKGITEGDVLFVGHGPITAAIAYHLAGNAAEARQYCLSCDAKEGSRFIIEYPDGGIDFVSLEE